MANQEITAADRIVSIKSLTKKQVKAAKQALKSAMECTTHIAVHSADHDVAFFAHLPEDDQRYFYEHASHFDDGRPGGGCVFPLWSFVFVPVSELAA